MPHDIFVLILDKGLFALLIILAGAVSTVAMERIRATQAWATEIAKERLALYRRLITASHDVINQFVRVRAAQLRGVQPEALRGLDALQEARLRLALGTHEAAVLFSMGSAAGFDALNARVSALVSATPPAGSVEPESRELNDLFRVASADLRAELGPVLTRRRLLARRNAV